MNRPLVIIPLVTVVVIFGALGQTMFKSAINGIPVNSSVLSITYHLVRSGWFLAGIGFAAVGFATWLFTLARADLSFASPFLALGFPAILLFSTIILHEPIGLLRIIGTLVVTIGMFMVAYS